MKPISDDCPEIQAQLPLYVGGDLESTAASDVSAGDASAGGVSAGERVRRHLAVCVVCAGELASLKAALDAIGALRSEKLPEIDVWDGVRAELVSAGVIRAEPASVSTSPVPSPVGRIVRPRFGLRGWRYAAAAVFMFGAGLALWNVASSPSTEADPASSGSVALDVPGAGPTAIPSATPTVELVDATPAAEPSKLAPALIEDANGLHKVGADEEPLWRSARPFGSQYALRRPQSAWQAASYPVLQDPRVR
jgi:mono/diheme cytochrome c family protein